MFFLTRSALCIAAVVLAIPSQTPPSGAEVTRATASAVQSLCKAAPERCATLVRDGIGALLQRNEAAPVPAFAPTPTPSHEARRRPPAASPSGPVPFEHPPRAASAAGAHRPLG